MKFGKKAWILEFQEQNQKESSAENLTQQVQGNSSTHSAFPLKKKMLEGFLTTQPEEKAGKSEENEHNEHNEEKVKEMDGNTSTLTSDSHPPEQTIETVIEQTIETVIERTIETTPGNILSSTVSGLHDDSMDIDDDGIEHNNILYVSFNDDSNSRLAFNNFGINGTYASALYTAAAKASSLDAVERSLDQIRQELSDPQLATFVANPTLTSGDKKAIVDSLTSKTAEKSLVKNFLVTLGDNNRLSHLQGIAVEFEKLMRATKGEVDVVITSAQPLDNRTLSRLQGTISKSGYIGENKKIRLQNKVSENIMGGLVVEIGDRTIDLSVSSRVSKLNKLLQESL